MNHMLRKVPVLALLCLLAFLPAFARGQGVYTPPGLYDVRTLRLDNGFRVLLKQRSGTHNVSFRLVVGLGTRHFDCSRRETPHLLEHLLFSGTSRHTETELEQMVQELGGSWNAVTGTEHTTYQLDIFDRYALQGLDVLHEIVTDTVITTEKVSRAKSIVYREEGAKPGVLRRFLYGFGISKNAWKKANEWLLPGTGAVCSGLVDQEDITEQYLAKTLRTDYVPEAMTLIVVGNFDAKRLLDHIEATFGSIPPAPKPVLTVVTPPLPLDGPATVSSTLSPFFGAGGSYSIAYRTAGRTSEDAAAMIVLSNYLNTRFYERIRVNAGLSYAPEAEMFFQPDYGIFYATADVSAGSLSRVREVMQDVLETLRRERISPEEIERTKRKILLQWAQGFETNAGLASLYMERLSYAEHLGGGRRAEGLSEVPGYEIEIDSVTPADLDRVIKRYLRPERRIDILSMPSVSYALFFSVMAGLFLVAAAIVLYRMRREKKRRRSMLPSYIHRR